MNTRLIRTAAALTLAGMLLAGCSQPAMPASLAGVLGGAPSAAPAAAATAVVNAGTVETFIVATGKVAARQSATLSFPRSGQVAAVHAAEGQAVRAGQPIAALDTSELVLAAEQQHAAYLNALAVYSQTVKGPSEAELKSAKAQLYSAQAAYSDLQEPPTENEVAALRASLLNAEAELRRAQSEYDRAYSRNPAAIGAAPEALALEKATNAFHLAQANYDRAFEQAAPAALANASAQISAARARLDALTPISETIQQAEARRDQAYAAWQQAELNVQKATLIAPFDGTLTRVAFETGDWVAAGAPAVEIADLRSPWFEMQVDEADLGGVRVGGQASVALQAYPDQPVPATVESIASTGASAGSVVTFRVRLALPGDAAAPGTAAAPSGDPVVLLGMSGTAEVVTGLALDVLVVPNAALIVDRETRSFSVRKLGADGQPVETPVQVGLRGADETQIVAGLSAGDVVVVQGK